MERIQYHRYGGPDVMQIEPFEPRPLKDDEVLVRPHVMAINPIDWKVRRGDLKMVTGKHFPRGIGSDFAGEVLATGKAVTRVRAGEHVFGLATLKDSGAFAGAVVAPEGFVAAKPDSLSFEKAAGLGTTGVTAWIALVEKGRVGPQSTVFVNGCTGGVGLSAVQIAKSLGARVVGTCRPERAADAKAAGVDEPLDYRLLDLTRIGDRFDVVIDTADVMTVSDGLSLLKQGGIFVPVNVRPIYYLRALFQRRLKVVTCAPRAEIMEALAALAGRGALAYPIARRDPLSQGITVLRDLEQSGTPFGKCLLQAD